MDKPRIVVVDDRDGISNYYQEFLHDEAFTVTVAENTKQAVSLIAGNPPDLIIVDVAKVEDRQGLSKLIERHKLIVIWASKFENIDLEDLPLMARILNKPFRHTDLKLAIKSEFSKAKRGFDIW